jgi:glutathione synthase/RimK-type ligase-like ATP-grasp enzyme
VKTVALVTCAEFPNLSHDDRLLLPELDQFGFRGVPIRWDAAVGWTQFDRVVIRSCWDYHLRFSEFLDWLEKVTPLAPRLQNTSSLVRWNADKRYLRELQNGGVKIPPTIWIAAGEVVNVTGLLKDHDWESGIVKPTVSASAHGLLRVFGGDSEESIHGPAMIQQFMPQVLDTGEWSLVFIGGHFSHAALKRPASGDFRVQSQYGGSAIFLEPNQRMIETATAMLNALPDVPLYARIDGIEVDGDLVLMEMELIEPELFLELGNAAGRFAEAIAG